MTVSDGIVRVMQDASPEGSREEREAGEQDCSICGPGRSAEIAPYRLTHGVTLMLCAEHRHDSYVRAEAGELFCTRLRAIWQAHGTATARRLQALDTHLRRCDPAERRELPGSYSWPLLRKEAERRFAGGEQPDDVIRDLRRRYHAVWASVPSTRTMRRWNHQRRWLSSTPTRPENVTQTSRPQRIPGPRDHSPFPWRRLRRWNMLIGSEEQLFGPLAVLIFEDRKPWLREDAGLGRDWHHPRRE